MWILQRGLVLKELPQSINFLKLRMEPLIQRYNQKAGKGVEMLIKS